VSLSFDIQKGDSSSPCLGEAAALHVICLPGTLTSQRGSKTTAGLYRHLLLQGHAAHIAISSNRVVGGLIVMRHGCRKSNIFIAMYRPWSWIIALHSLGVRNAFTQLQDLSILHRASQQLAPHDYIVALYVADSSRRIGVASKLVQQAISDAKIRGVGLAVDTTLANDSARNLYKSLGFAESHQTKYSVQFTLEIG